MGKKDKNKKTGKGAEKTAIKTQKKLKSKLMKLTGEDAIENMVKAIEEEEKQRKSVKEIPVEGGKPSSRANFSMVAHPDNPEIILFGGEFHNGQKTTMFNELIFYNLKKKSWTLIQSPGAPPPRSSHQAVVSSQSGGQLWIFGGEFASPSESQFYHYRDLWLYHFTTKRWEKIVSADAGGPTPRSGHRMILVKKHLLIFGGFHDVLAGETKYFNDVHLFDTSDRKWKKLEVSGTPPSPRSACNMYSLPDGRIVVYGGYCKEKIKGPKSKKAPEKGKILTDAFALVPDKSDESMVKWRWQSLKQSGTKPTPPRSGMCCAGVPNSNKAFLFGGVQDVEDDDDDEDEDASGQFFNEFFSIRVDNDKMTWQKVEYSSSDKTAQKRAQKADQEDSSEEESQDEDSQGADEAIKSMVLDKEDEKTVTVAEGIFTVTSTVASKASTSEPQGAGSSGASLAASISVPSPRYASSVVVKQGVLYLFGGIFEDKDDRQITFNDFYSIDLKKLDSWVVLIEPDFKSVEWIEVDSESSDSSDAELESGDDDESDEMDTD